LPGSVEGHHPPNSVAALTQFNKNDHIVQRHNVRINNLGWISHYNYERSKAPNEFRIAIVGDSMTASQNNEIPWPDVLQRKLNADADLLAALDVKTITVLNLGVAGAEVAKRLLVHRVLLTLKPLALLEVLGRPGIPRARAAEPPTTMRSGQEAEDIDIGLRALRFIHQVHPNVLITHKATPQTLRAIGSVRSTWDRMRHPFTNNALHCVVPKEIGWSDCRPRRTHRSACRRCRSSYFASNALMAVGDTARALPDFIQALKSRPNDFGLLFRSATARVVAKDYPGAIRDLDTASLLQPGDAGVVFTRANARMALEQWSDALTDMDAAIAATPTNPAFYSTRVHVLNQLARKSEADADLRKA
jgi:tetratricopeptide (TPR) repeat protein